MNIARMLYVGCKILGFSEPEVFSMTPRKFHLIFREYQEFHGVKKKDELNLDAIF